jgi:hypothetical protein
MSDISHWQIQSIKYQLIVKSNNLTKWQIQILEIHGKKMLIKGFFKYSIQVLVKNISDINKYWFELRNPPVAFSFIISTCTFGVEKR